MIASDWGDWLVEAVESASPDPFDVWYLGCNGFVCKGADGTTVYVDPYLGTGDPPRTIRMIPVPFDPTDVSEADGVLVTHEHSDHVDGPSQAPILARTGCGLVGPGTSVDVARANDWTSTWEVDSTQFRDVEPGDSFALGGFDVTVCPANDPDADEPVSYVLEYEDRTFFHAGDSRPGAFSEVGASFDVDVGAVAFGSSGLIPDKETREPAYTTWYNDEGTIVDVANELELDRLVPTHWDMWKGLRADPTVLHHHVSSFPYPERIDVVEIGDRLQI